MPVHRDNLKDTVNTAWLAALGNPDRDHGNRSAQWVDALARQFQANYALGRRHRVFWKGNEDNKRHFGIRELLFDVTVCSVSTTLSLQSPPQSLEFISDCHWQIESEFADNSTRPVIVDMSKLVLGSAENKLTRLRQLGPLTDDNLLIFRDRTPKGRHYTARPRDPPTGLQDSSFGAGCFGNAKSS